MRMATLNHKALLNLVVDSIAEGGWSCLIIDDNKPFRLRVFRQEGQGFDVSLYLWNCTHGGGAKRASNEYRIQLTGTVPQQMPDIITVILGWHAGYGVFSGFDIERHSGQNSQSPSIQVKEETLKGAHQKAFSVSQRQNGELVVAFRPELLVDYILNARALHQQGITKTDLSLLNDLGTVPAVDLENVATTERKRVIATIARNYRAADFRARVLGAYRHQCAMCGVQLKLVDAAHIIPVASDLSTDETKNGIALCKLHHFAYDRNLISFDSNYVIEVSSAETSRLGVENLAGGIQTFQENLRTAIMLPSDRRDYPSSAYIERSREVRRWLP